ncbi:DUF423 domain-containing protein [Leptospira sp. 85282-16]|uniref:DUF423 domain-containing protein n=1 Tax=Leptospira montravelensis TaxID=2484961 RepID=A0ABY2LT78_9LEPT|nr:MULTISPECIES: DUF423 domain-containing protein [Leptospira]MCT8334320.1 DUF423 domain-containing protein [Leptospira sp. 85282-16]TGK80685.1 DUF423 domain-containing protein [Leptospira montravelensis]TGL01725.1 DUF423 domain-containing protein [Leptospira montravelensis]
MNLVKKQSSAFLILLICLSGFLAVAIGAFGAHGLKKIITPDLMVIFETGNRYHFYHTFVSLFAFLLLQHSIESESTNKSKTYLKIANWSFLLGILIFSFSLYALAITGIKILGAITPIGGVSFLIGWICLGIGSFYLFVPKK